MDVDCCDMAIRLYHLVHGDEGISSNSYQLEELFIGCSLAIDFT